MMIKNYTDLEVNDSVVCPIKGISQIGKILRIAPQGLVLVQFEDFEREVFFVHLKRAA